jgi:DNA-binding HxlR family transcriptional regulator
MIQLTELDGRLVGCPATKLLSIIEKPYTLQILHRLYNTSPLRFTELQNRLGVSPKVLTSRLQVLGELGVVVRKSHDEIPPRVDYALSPKGMDLVLRIPIDLTASKVKLLPVPPGKMFDELQAWAAKYNFVELNGKKAVSASTISRSSATRSSPEVSRTSNTTKKVA